MKNFKIYAILTFLFLGGNSVSAQSMMDLYFGGNKDSLTNEGTKLIHLPEPNFKPIDHQTESHPALMAVMGFEQDYKSEIRFFTVRDSKRLFSHRFPNRSETTFVLIPGVAGSAYLNNKTAGLLQEANQAEIYAIDLRGHGQSDGNSGDVTYINQYVDDLADIIKETRKEKHNGKIIIAGHSMGGGVALRYAMEKQYEQPDGFLVFTPLIGHNSPTIQQGQATENIAEEPFIKIHNERIIGLAMLNEIGNHDYDSLPFLFFNLPETVPLRKYSHRANTSMTPSDYVTGLKAVKAPMLVMIGSNDEAFSAEVFQKAVLESSSGKVHIIDKTSHIGVRHNTQSFDFVKNWFSKL